MKWQSDVSLFLRSHLPIGSRVLVAVSGGPDSVALAHFMRTQPYRWVMGHVDHRLRKDSAADARFVRSLGRQWEIPIRLQVVNVKRFAQHHRMGIEESARTLRYQALTAMAKQARCAAILTAHTADDQSETVLMNFLRGAGPTGLAGMPAKRSTGARGPALLRPFLRLRKRQVLEYIGAHRLPYRHDSSNDAVVYTRNRIRHLALPYLEKLSPGLSQRLRDAADIFRTEEEFWQSQVQRELGKTVRKNGQRITVVLPRLLGYHKALSRRILRHVLPGLSFQDIEQVLTVARTPERTAWLKLPRRAPIRRVKDKLVVYQKRSE